MSAVTILKLGLRNLSYRRTRTFFLAIFVLILSAALFTTNILTDSMEQCIDKTVDRIGADIIITPKEYTSEFSDALFSGELCSFYFPKSAIDSVKSLDGIEEISPQLYITTLDAACCSVPIQIVAYEPETDFIVQSWLAENSISKPEKGQVILGSKIAKSPGDKISFFNLEYDVAAKLEQTDTSYDNCAFMSFETAYTLFESDQIKYVTDLTEPEKYVSSLMIRTSSGLNLSEIANRINYRMPELGLSAFTVKGMSGKVSDALTQMKSYRTILVGLLFLMAILALVCIFNITIHERLREFGILLSVGAKRKQIFGMLLFEASVIGLIGGSVGVFIAGGGILLFSDVIISKMTLPYLTMDVATYLTLALQCIGIAWGTNLISTLYAAFKIQRMEPFRMIQEVQL